MTVKLEVLLEKINLLIKSLIHKVQASLFKLMNWKTSTSNTNMKNIKPKINMIKAYMTWLIVLWWTMNIWDALTWLRKKISWNNMRNFRFLLVIAISKWVVLEWQSKYLKTKLKKMIFILSKLEFQWWEHQDLKMEEQDHQVGSGLEVLQIKAKISIWMIWLMKLWKDKKVEICLVMAGE